MKRLLAAAGKTECSLRPLPARRQINGRRPFDNLRSNNRLSRSAPVCAVALALGRRFINQTEISETLNSICPCDVTNRPIRLRNRFA